VKSTTKERLLSAINAVLPLHDYEGNDCIYSQKYSFSPAVMVYILQKLTQEFQFTITDDFVDALEMCTFAQLEALLEEYSGKAA